MKKIFIVNGKPASGKTLFAKLSKYFVDVYEYSSISYVKTVAVLCGWSGTKTEKDRKFLSDLKVLTSEFSDLSYKEVIREVDRFNMFGSDNSVMLIDVREPADIDRLKKDIGAETIFIVNPKAKSITSNMADANVNHYDYDHYIYNNGECLDKFEKEIKEFYKGIKVIE